MAVVVVILLRLLIGPRIVQTAAAAGRRIARAVRAAVGRIEITVVGLHLWRVLSGRQLLRRYDHRLSGGVILILRGRVATGDGGSGPGARIARQRDRGRTGERHRGVENALLLDQRIQRRGVGARQPHAAMRHRCAETAFGFGAVNGMTDLGEEDRVRHRRVVELLGEMVFLHSERPEAAVRRFMRWIAGRDRPLVALDAVNRDGHRLRVLVDGDGNLGLRAAGGEKHQTRTSNQEGTHFTFGLQASTAVPLRPSPRALYA
jgi:hypothetical protein